MLVEMNYKIAILVLIGTLWNVNTEYRDSCEEFVEVLIGTLWNVNKFLA